MRTTSSSWVQALLLISAATTQATLNLHETNVRPEAIGRRIQDLISGEVHSANALDNGNLVARNAQNGLDANALLAGIAQSQGQKPSTGDIVSSDIAGSLANQVAGGSTPSINDVLNGLNGQQQSGTNSQSTSQQQGQTAPVGTTPQAAQGIAPGGSQSAPGVVSGSSQPAQGVAPGANQAASSTTQSGSPRPASDINTSNPAGDLANQLAPQTQSENPVVDVGGSLVNQLLPGAQSPQ
ncbi:hypothetical protein PTT_10259, partial [Pyrenophora teres f. teres 0-1]